MLRELHDVLTASGEFDPADVKSRMVRHAEYLVGDGAPDRAFVALEIRILSGRSAAFKAGLSEAALEVLKRAFPVARGTMSCSFSVQVSEMDRPSYRRSRGTEGG